MAEDDDDETFGEFTFASSQSNSQFNCRNSLPGEEDDEWGDFVKSPQQSSPHDPSFKGNHKSDNSVSPPLWVKPTGALPLSIFGDVEEEEESFAVSVDLNQGKSSVVTGDFNSSIVDNDVANTRNLSIADLFNQYSQVKPENRPGSNSTGRVDSVENGVYSGSYQNASTSAVTELKNVDLNDTIGISGHSQLANKRNNDEFSFWSYVPDPSENANVCGGWTPESFGFSSNLNTAAPNGHKSSSDLDINGQKHQLDGFATAIDDNGGDEWEFKDAFSEFRTEEVNNNVDLMAPEISNKSAYSSGTGNGSSKSLDFFGTSNGSTNFFATSTESVDYFATSSGISSTSQGVHLTGVQPSIATLNVFTSDTNSIIEQNNVKSLLNPRTDVENAELDEDFGEFTAASAETGPKPWEVSTNDVRSLSKDTASTADGKIQEEDMKLNYHNGAIPLSIFGNEEPESGGFSDVQDVFVHQSTSHQKSSHTPKTVVSINDLISSLYSQAEQTSINTVKEPSNNQLSLSNAVSGSNLVNDGDHLDDNSWNFKVAIQKRVDSEASPRSSEDTYPSVSSKLKLKNYLDFYSKLKEELCLVAKCHIERLKQARADAALSGDDARAASLDCEFQLVCKELEEMNFLFEESNSLDHTSGHGYLNEFVEVLLEPQFQLLDSEYHLSEMLLLVEKDLQSAVQLIRHTTTMLKILTIGSVEEQRVYIAIWSEMISVCARELRHGASIWNQAVEKHVQSQLLSEPQGRKFLLALGEIYRVVVVLGASTKLFRPWMLSGLVDSPAIYILLEECHAVWSTSGLEEALLSVLPTAMDNTLFKSIKHILGLDALTLQKYVLAETESRCWLSILTETMAPGMKMIMWGKEQYFVTLANLWANLISSNLPKLPQLKFG